MGTIRYSAEFKERALQQVYCRKGRTIEAVAAELNMNLYSLKNWMRDAVKSHKKPLTETKRPNDWLAQERLLALQESYALGEPALSVWCRERGLFVHNLTQWRTEFCNFNTVKNADKNNHALRQLKVEHQALKRDLNRKEKALAETAALLVLQKKFHALLGGEAE